MKKYTYFAVIAASLLISFSSSAKQSLDIIKGNVTYRFTAEQTGEMAWKNGTTLTVLEKEFGLTDFDRIEVIEDELDDNTVTIDYSGDNAYVVVAGNVARYVDVTVSGAHVSINQSADVSDSTCGEITYSLAGTSTNGSFTQSGSYKTTLELRGLTLTNPGGAAIDIQNGKRIAISAKNGTENNLIDGPGSQKAALYCKGHLELKGKGTLNVTGNYAHAIAAKEYIEMKNLTLNVNGSVKDGVNCTQYFRMESGTLTISNPGDDGIQVDYKDNEGSREDEDTGSITIIDGSITINDITATAAKAIKCEGDFVMSGGQITAKTSAPGTWDSAKLKTKASACLGVDGGVVINGGSLNLTATGGGAKGITCDGDFVFDGGSLTITTSGGVLAYTNGSINQNYTGNTDNLKSDYKSSPKGVKADGKVEINGGDIFITTSGNGGEGIESKSTLTINDGNVKVRAKDDAINSSSHMYIKGGVIDVISTGNDGLDSNGDLNLSGGIVMAFGGSAPECGLDANSEEGYKVYITGGYILAAGGGNSIPTSSYSDAQPFVTVSSTLSANQTVSIGTSTSTLYTFTTPADLTSVNLGGSTGNRPGGPGGMGQGGSSVLISVPGLTNGTSYTVKCGTSSTTATAKNYGTSSGPGGR